MSPPSSLKFDLRTASAPHPLAKPAPSPFFAVMSCPLASSQHIQCLVAAGVMIPVTRSAGCSQRARRRKIDGN